MILVAERGLLTEDNFEMLEQIKLPGGRAVEYIVAVPVQLYTQMTKVIGILGCTIVGPEKLCRLILLMVLQPSAMLDRMVRFLHFLVSFFTASVRTRLSLQLEIAALRHQLSVYRLERRRPSIRPADRLLWSILARFWSDWRRALFFVQPRTLVVWQKKRFRDYWRALSQQGGVGRPRIAPELRHLIRRMWQANPAWGSPHASSREIHGREIQTDWGELTLRDLARISRPALERARRRRLLYRAHGNIQSAVRFPRVGT